MKRNYLFPGVTLLLILGFALPLQAKTLYIRGLQVFLQDAPAQTGTKGMKLNRGDQVEQISEQGMWIKVKVADHEGWLPKFALADQSIPNRVSMLNQKEVDLSANARRRASTYSSTAAVRGLTADARKRVNTLQLPDYYALDDLEKQSIDETVAVQFLTKE